MNDIKRAAIIKQMQAEFEKVARLLAKLEHDLYRKTEKKAA